MNRHFKALFFIIAMAALFTAAAESGDITFEASVNKNKVSLGTVVQLTLTFDGAQDVPAPILPDIEGFDSRYLGPSSMMSIMNGKVSSSIAHNYALMPLKTGTYTIKPISVTHEGKTYTSQPISIEVVQGPVYEPKAASPGMPSGTEEALKDRIFLVIEPVKPTAYINEPIPVTVKLYVNNLAVKNVQYPLFEHEGFSMTGFDKPVQYRAVMGGIAYDVLEFRNIIYPVKSGELSIGPAKTNCEVVVRKSPRSGVSSRIDDFFGEDVFDDFFTRYETYPMELESKRVTLTALPLPEKGRPAEFNGAIGDFDFDIMAKPTEVEAGDPITLSMRISGAGNFDTITAPTVETSDNFKTYEPQAKIDKDEKVFEQILMPVNEKVKAIPQISFSFFDTTKGYYRTITKGPISIYVTPREKEEELKIVEYPQGLSRPLKSETLGRDIIYIKQSPGTLKQKGAYFFNNKLFTAAWIFPFAGLMAFLGVYRRKERVRNDIRYARRLRAPKKAKEGIKKAAKLLKEGKTEEFYGAIFKTIQEYLGNKLHIPEGGITIDVCDSVLKPKHVSEDTLEMLRAIFRDCDMARYAPSEFTKSDMEKIMKNAGEVMDSLERSKL